MLTCYLQGLPGSSHMKTDGSTCARTHSDIEQHQVPAQLMRAYNQKVHPYVLTEGEPGGCLVALVRQGYEYTSHLRGLILD